MAKYGLIGKNIGYSFSKDFFTKKFKNEKKKNSYHNFDIASIDEFPEILMKHKDIRGLNVTTPYKEQIIPFLDRIDKEAKQIGAVNAIKVKGTKLIGYNTDDYGFAKSLESIYPIKKTALILGSGGAAKAIAFVLKSMSFQYKIVSRSESQSTITYGNLSDEVMSDHALIINCTPLGTFPNIYDCPKIPYELLTDAHVLYDLVYNPSETEFLKRGFTQGARVKNGLEMLEYQAKKSWEIWKS